MQVLSGSGLVLVLPGSHLCTKCLSSAIIAACRRTAGHDTGTNIRFKSVWSEKLIREGYFPSLPETSRWCSTGLYSSRKFSPSVLRAQGTDFPVEEQI